MSTQLLDLGEVYVGSSNSLSVLLLNEGNAGLALSTPSYSGAGFSASTQCQQSLAVGASCSTTVTFAPTVAGTVNGNLRFSFSAAPAIDVALTGKGLLLAGQWSAIESADFGDTYLASPRTSTFMLTNTGNVAIPLGFASVEGAGYSLVSNTCGTAAARITLEANAVCAVAVRFAPSSLTTYPATLRMSTGTASLATLALTGRGVNSQGTLVAATSADFGTVVTGSFAERSFTYTVTGNVPAGNVRAAVAGNDLSITSSTCGTVAQPLASLASGTSCSVTVRYAPATAGALSSASVTVSSNTDSDSVTLQGAAQAALAANCKRDSAGQVWCMGVNNADTGNMVCGYPSDYSGTYYAVTTAAAAAHGRTISGTDCATNYTGNTATSTTIVRSGLTCQTNQQRWSRSGAPSGVYSRVFVRCTNME